MAEFQLRLTGLCAIGPHDEDAQGVHRKVMLVNARDRRHAGSSDHQAHVAALLVPFDNLDLDATGARDFDFRFDGLPARFDHSDMVAFLLKGEDLTLLTLEGDQVKPVPGPDDPSLECPTSQKDGFGWVTSVKRAEDAKPTDAALTGKDKSIVLGRLRIERGLLGTSEFVRHPENNHVVKWKYLKERDEDDVLQKARAVAEVVKLTSSFTSSQLRIKSTLFPNQALPDIVLKPHLGQVDIWLVNMPILDIVGPDQTPRGEPRPDFHFLHYYHLTDKHDGKKLPKPKGGICPLLTAGDREKEKGARKAKAAASNPKCPPTSFEG